MGKTFAGLGMLAAVIMAGCSADNETAEPAAGAEPGAVSLKPAVTHEADPLQGRALFVEKGCVICHAVNGVGGKATPTLDAEIGAPPVDALEFAARMWRGAPAMIELQSIELGYTIYLTADEIAHLAAFAADRDAQKDLKLEDLPETIRSGLLDERFWEMENWDDYLSRGREGEFPEQAEEPGEENE